MFNRKPQTSGSQSRFGSGDVFYFAFLLVLVSASTAFPFYVHFHRDQFGPPEMHFYGAEQAAEQTQPGSPVYQRNIVAQVKPRLELDQMTTATIRPSSGSTKKPRLKPLSRQPFPEEEAPLSSSIEILFVTSERLLAVENGRIVSFRIGSQLADGTQITEIGKTNGTWVIKTSGERTMSWSR